mmetsp:Transcript_61988/g.102347  ORF Transcript_61988/g.102347 Transcript_61988/m.102347 type:complete len:301 (+) Transcript_61988:988-1890(+)
MMTQRKEMLWWRLTAAVLRTFSTLRVKVVTKPLPCRHQHDLDCCQVHFLSPGMVLRSWRPLSGRPQGKRLQNCLQQANCHSSLSLRRPHRQHHNRSPPQNRSPRHNRSHHLSRRHPRSCSHQQSPSRLHNRSRTNRRRHRRTNPLLKRTVAFAPRHSLQTLRSRPPAPHQKRRPQSSPPSSPSSSLPPTCPRRRPRVKCPSRPSRPLRRTTCTPSSRNSLASPSLSAGGSCALGVVCFAEGRCSQLPPQHFLPASAPPNNTTNSSGSNSPAFLPQVVAILAHSGVEYRLLSRLTCLSAVW